MPSLPNRLHAFLSGPVSHTERLVSTAGGCIAIYAILTVSQYHLGNTGALLIVPSMGASAVLLFAVPHGALSQPWNVFGGHLLSALIGVTFCRLVPDMFMAAALAVGISIGVMYYLRCIHPPGGATALAAVIGGDATHALGYQFVLTPVLENVLVILFVAALFNLPFDWRRYPAWLVRKREQEQPPPPQGTPVPGKPPIEHADLVAALATIDSFIDVSEDDLLRIYHLATGQAQTRSFPPEAILPGHYYSNGAAGNDWSVRHVVDAAGHDDPQRDMVVFQVVDGRGLRNSGAVTRTEFARWVSYEVLKDGAGWTRLE